MPFSQEEKAACQRLVELALAEDLGPTGDLTSQAVIPAELKGDAVFVARSAGVVAGLPAASLVVEALAGREAEVSFRPLVEEGARVSPGDRLATIAGSMRGILAAERTALNFLQYLSGIATLTRNFVDARAGLPCKIMDTRKTLAGWRLLAKYAVRQGGGHNHRLGLFDGILIKDNHLAALGQGLDAVTQAVRSAQAAKGEKVPVEVEVDSLEQLEKALSCQPDIILLDNMALEQLREAVKRRNQKAPNILLEASGGVNLQTVRAIAETGVDRISVGALTHSVPALDIALDYAV